MQSIEQLLQVSANLYKLLGEIPEERDSYIENINAMLDKRGIFIKRLQEENFKFDAQNRVHNTLLELDNGIKQRLAVVMEAVKKDMANLQKTKKSEEQYFNPYANVRVMDGMYYDKKN
ncbi:MULTISPECIES: flagellar assembly protein FliT [Lysinibacillus]|uniref:Flagellar protein FliT n=1 Tax=Lysinibacillus fusiformis TaxID=28031 RepID=A0A1E4R383_9BACI|nr:MULTISPECIES: flagellar assembly protein FliT [Lysinibacillus]ODV54878.1 flagellar assembly protein FliT [Lysinibacillus fusiformis]HBI99861.1 flagellar protein FliT [Lysinibacillus sp.]